MEVLRSTESNTQVNCCETRDMNELDELPYICVRERSGCRANLICLAGSCSPYSCDLTSLVPTILVEKSTSAETERFGSANDEMKVIF